MVDGWLWQQSFWLLTSECCKSFPFTPAAFQFDSNHSIERCQHFESLKARVGVPDTLQRSKLFWQFIEATLTLLMPNSEMGSSKHSSSVPNCFESFCWPMLLALWLRNGSSSSSALMGKASTWTVKGDVSEKLLNRLRRRNNWKECKGVQRATFFIQEIWIAKGLCTSLCHAVSANCDCQHETGSWCRGEK